MRPPLPSGSFCGKTLKTYRAGDLVLDGSSYPPGIEIPKHAHAHPVLSAARDGLENATTGDER
jgi:hypothetical protein